MRKVATCSVCDRELPDDAPLGLCPACLFEAALSAESSETGSDSSSSVVGSSWGSIEVEPVSSFLRRSDLPSTEGRETGGCPLPDGERGLETTRTGGGPSGTHAWTESSRPLPVLGVPGYELLGRLGQGGMGVVYKALQRRANRIVALKMIRGDAQLLPEQLDRFRAEVQAAARLKHPNVVQIYDVGEVDGRPYFSLEFLEGGSLKDLLARSPMSSRAAADNLAGLARAADAAHRAGIIHRDLKPSNVLFDAQGTPRIADFGLAKRIEDDEGQTLPGQVVGTPSYMSPEQARGERRAIGPGTDIYALGAILYEMLTGRPPFRGATSSETIHLVVTQEPLAPSRLQPRVPRDLETICLKCLRKEPEDRYHSACQLADDLDRFLAGKPIHARRTPAWERAAKWARRKPALATIVFVSAVSAVLLAGAAERSRADAQAESRRQQKIDDEMRQETAEVLGKSATLKGQGKVDDAWHLLDTWQVRLQQRERLASLLRLVNNELRDVERRRAGRDAEQARFEAQQAERTRFEGDFARFLALRDVALFHDAGIDVCWRDPLSGEDVRGPDRVLQTRETARKALSIFAAGGEVGTLAPLPATSTVSERDEVRSGTYLLLMVLSEAVSDPLPGEEARGQAGKALALLDRAATMRAPTVAYHLRRASSLARYGEAAEARRESERASELTPAEAFDHLLLGRECSRSADWDAARSHFMAAIRKRPELTLAHYLLASAALHSNPPRAAEAISELNHCLIENRSYAWLYQLRGLACGQMGAALGAMAVARGQVAAADDAEARYDDAEADFLKALELGLGRDLHYSLLMSRGTIRFRRGRHADAASDFEAAIALDSHRFNGHASLAQALRKLGRRDEAIARFGDAIARAPGLPALYRGRALAQIDRDDYTPDQARAAIADLRESARLEAIGSGEAAADHARVARLLLHLDHSPDGLAAALKAADSALKIAPGLTDAHLVRIAVLLDQERYEQVIAACETALTNGAKLPALYMYRGLGRVGRHDFAGAVDDYSKALALRPDWDEALGHRGWAYLLSDAPELAVHDFEKLITGGSGKPRGYAGRAAARVRRGDLSGGLADAEEAVRRAGTSSWMFYIAAQTYAYATTMAVAEATRRGRPATRTSLSYESRAEDLLRQAIACTPAARRPAFWRDVVMQDSAMKPILRNPQILKRLMPVVLSAR